MLLSANIVKLYDAFGTEKTLDMLARAGFSGVDFNFDLKEYHTGEHDARFYRELAGYAASRGLTICQAHAPFPSSYADEERTEKRFFEIVTSIQGAAALGAPMIVVHPGTHLDYEANAEALFEWNLDFYRRLSPYAREAGIRIAIENIERVSVTSTPERLCRLYDALADPVFTICFDAGHCLLQEVDPAAAILTLGERLKHGCTHIHDNAGDRDSHTLPYYGEVDWESAMRALAEIGYCGALNYEASGFLKNLPTALYEDALLYMARVGHYLVGRVEHHKAARG